MGQVEFRMFLPPIKSKSPIKSQRSEAFNFTWYPGTLHVHELSVNKIYTIWLFNMAMENHHF